MITASGGGDDSRLRVVRGGKVHVVVSCLIRRPSSPSPSVSDATLRSRRLEAKTGGEVGDEVEGA